MGKSQLYLMQAKATDFYKIGISVDPARRLGEVQTDCPFTVELVNTWRVDDAAIVERDLHAKLASIRQEGEWFDFAGDRELVKKAFASLEGKPAGGAFGRSISEIGVWRLVVFVFVVAVLCSLPNSLNNAGAVIIGLPLVIAVILFVRGCIGIFRRNLGGM